jgi:hypothetical protein
MNRSPTVAVALLMAVEGLSLRDAWTDLKRSCPSAYPQPDNREELVRWERLLTGSPNSSQDASMAAEDFKTHGTDDAEQLSVYCRTESVAPDVPIYRCGEHAYELYLLLGQMHQI